MCLDHKKALKKTKIKLHNTLNLLLLLYGSKTWTIKARNTRRITAAEMKNMRTAGYTWTHYKTNTQITKEFKNNTNSGQITGIQEKLDTTCK